MSRKGRPLNTFFVITSMHVGGAETLLLNLINRVDRSHVNPHLVCLKELGPLGEELSRTIPTYHSLTRNKFDIGVLFRLCNIFRQGEADAVITVGAGDKMFWGRLASKLVGVGITASALHSTGWPDGINFANRMLTPITDAFIAVADAHRDYLRDIAGLPSERISVVPNGIDTERFKPNQVLADETRRELECAKTDPVVGIVAALRPEKDHALFLDVAKRTLAEIPNAKFWIIGDGPERESIERKITDLGIASSVRLLGSRSDTERYLAAMNAFMLTSKNEAKPVSILEALATQVPCIAPDVGSINESIIDGSTGFLVSGRNPDIYAERLTRLLQSQTLQESLGRAGRTLVETSSSLNTMVHGYESLLWQLHCSRRGRTWPNWIAQAPKRLASSLIRRPV